MSSSARSTGCTIGSSGPAPLSALPHAGKLIKHYIYEQLPPGVLAELELLNPKNQNGNRSRKHHQHLTPETETRTSTSRSPP